MSDGTCRLKELGMLYGEHPPHILQNWSGEQGIGRLGEYYEWEGTEPMAIFKTCLYISKDGVDLIVNYINLYIPVGVEWKPKLEPDVNVTEYGLQGAVTIHLKDSDRGGIYIVDERVRRHNLYSSSECAHVYRLPKSCITCDSCGYHDRKCEMFPARSTSYEDLISIIESDTNLTSVKFPIIAAKLLEKYNMVEKKYTV